MNVGQLERKRIIELKHDRGAYTICTEKNGKSKRAQQAIWASIKACGNTGSEQEH